MPLIQNINARRRAFERRGVRVAERIAEHHETGFRVDITGLEGLADLPQQYINRAMLIRVNQDLAQEFQAGLSEWPEETQFSRQHFRGSDQGITNIAFYAPYVEDREDPRTYPAHPARRYAELRWVKLAERDIRDQQRIARRRG